MCLFFFHLSVRSTVLPLFILLLFWTAGAAAQEPVISEFMASNNNTLLDEDGDSSDWIEIHNPTAGAVSLAGWYLTDDASRLNKWPFPGESIPAGGYLIVFASGKNRRVAGAELHTTFQLSANGEYLGLIRPNLTPASEFPPAYPPQREDISYGWIDDAETVTPLLAEGGAVQWRVPPDGALGDTWRGAGFNPTGWTTDSTALGFSSDPALMVYLPFDETSGATAADASGNARDGAVSGAAWVNDATRGRVLEFGAGDFVRAPFDQLQGAFTISLWAYWTAPVSLNDGLVQLQFGGSVPDGASKVIGAWVNSAGPIWGRLIQANNTAVNLPQTGATMPQGAWKHIVYRANGSTYEVFVDGVATGPSVAYDGTIRAHDTLFVGRQGGESWNGRIDDVAVWGGALTNPQVASLAGGAAPGTISGFAALVETDVSAAMLGTNAPSLYLRSTFRLDSAPDFDTLRLRVRYDDGVVAWLNGSFLVNRNAIATPSWNSIALAPRSNALAAQFEEIDLTSQLGQLQTGLNVLAVQGLNVAGNDGDFLLEPALEATNLLGARWLFNDTPSPGVDNVGGYEGFVADTNFSVHRGYFSAPFSVVISSLTPGVRIYYTTDGGIPASDNPTASLYAAPIPVSRTTTLRAIAIRAGWKSTDVDAQTYIFTNDVLNQDPHNDPLAPTYPTIWQGGYTGDYEMDPRICTNTLDPLYQPTLPTDLLSIPTLSIVMKHEDLWDPANGIYVDATRRGDAYRRACSVEYFDPLGTAEFQYTCGVQMHGNASRDNMRLLKHSFRLIFNEDFIGPNELNYPLFADSDKDKFNTIVLRACFTDSFPTRSQAGRYSPLDSQYLRDIWMRDTHGAMGHVWAHSTNVHLYINGLYWGLYNPSERPDDAFMELHLGGAREEYDIIKDFNELYRGNKVVWDAMFALANAGLATDAAYQQIQGNNPDGTPNPALPNYLDVDNLIDFMMLHIFAGAEDWPSHNWYAARNRVRETTGFKFFVWDQEISLDTLTRDRSDVSNDMTPARLYWQLRANPEFRLRWADRVHKHMFNGGALSVAQNQARYLVLANRVESAIIGESARWGDARENSAEYPIGQVMTIDDWRTERDDLLNNYLPAIHGITIQRFRDDNLYPAVEPSAFSRYGGPTPRGYGLTMTNPNAAGTIRFTTDGSDPRLMGGAVSPTAQLYAATVSIDTATTVKARVLDGVSWSALTEATFTITNSPTQEFLRVTELHYHPADATPAEAALGFTNRDDFEFIELVNASTTQTLDLTDIVFGDGIDFAFSTATVRSLAPGARVLIVANEPAFEARYSPGLNVAGYYQMRLNNDGEHVAINDSQFGAIQDFTYNDAPPWPTTPDGQGPSLEAIDIWGNYNDPANWRASGPIGGTPHGYVPPVDPPSNVPLRVTEIHYHPTDPTAAEVIAGFTNDGEFEFIELLNISTTETLSLAGIRLTDGLDFYFSSGTLTQLAPGERVVVAANTAALAERYGAVPGLTGAYDPERLNNAGELLRLVDAAGLVIQEFIYGTTAPWPTTPDGAGPSLEVIDTAGDYNDPANWHASAAVGGSPGGVVALEPSSRATYWILY